VRADVAKGDNGSDGYEYVPPDFDEDAFIHKEMVEYKTTVIRSIVAVVAAVAAWAAFIFLEGDDRLVWWAGLAICAVFGLALKPIFQRYTDISQWKRMDWFGTGFMYFLTWLALFTVAVNPPVSDISPPQVQASADMPVQQEGGTVNLYFLATDNDHLEGEPQFTLTRDGQPLTPMPPVSQTRPGHYTMVLSNPTTVAGRYTATAVATDGRGHTIQAAVNFTIQAGEAIKVFVPPGGNLTVGGAEEILVRLDAKPCTLAPYPCVHSVYFQPNASLPSVPFEYTEAKGGWIATAMFDKWSSGTSTGRIVAQFLDHYQGQTRIAGGKLETKGMYTFHVEPASERHTVSLMPQPGAPYVSVPGYGALGTLAAVLGCAFLLRRRDL